MQAPLATNSLSHSTLERLMHYHHFLEKRLRGGARTATSTQLAESIHVDDTLVRKDLAMIGVRGHPRIGFEAAEVVSAIRKVLGFDKKLRAAVVGMGRLGSALASFRGFGDYGVEVCALFDNDPIKIGLLSGDNVVLPLDRLSMVVRSRGINIVILTVPPEAAQEVAQLAVDAGIEAIWNFAGTELKLPHDVFVRHEHILVGLAELAYLVRKAENRS